MRGIIPPSIGVFVALLMVSGAQGAIVYSQTPVIDGGLASDLDPLAPSIPIGSIFAADDFALASAATVKSVVWRGNDIGTPAPDSFRIRFYTDAANQPSTLLQAFFIGTPTSRIDTGLDSAVGDIFEYVADLGSGINLAAATTYWISIYNNTAPDSELSYWGWAGNISVATGETAVRSFDNFSTWVTVSGGGAPLLSEEQYFQLADATIPIPAAIWLFGSALGLLGWIRRKKA